MQVLLPKHELVEAALQLHQQEGLDAQAAERLVRRRCRWLAAHRHVPAAADMQAQS
jgi:hypothetical protein